MEKLAKAKKTSSIWFQKTWLQWLIAVIFFFFTSWFYMGPAITSCSTFSPAYASDTTGGIAWFQWVSGNKLSWNYSAKSNYPVGETLQRPQEITSEAFNAPYRLLAHETSPICGVNLMLLASYMVTALAMFGLVKWLFKKTGIAYFAGFAAAYLPLHQLKSMSHLVYTFGAVFILIIWAYLFYKERPGYIRSALLAAATALAFYTDGYFILFASVLVSVLVACLLLPLDPPKRKKTRQRFEALPSSNSG